MVADAPASSWSGRRVLLTGHTGFIGGWLAHVLLALGARVTGYSDQVPTTPSLFEATGLARLVDDCRGDITDLERLSALMRREEPEVIFHLAAQPLVRRAFMEPLATYRANVLGTLTVLEAMRSTPSVSAAVLMTTDKVYRNREWMWPYRETDELGGHEPYGLSKAMAELGIRQYRETYFKRAQDGGVAAPRLVAVRAGNVIGGGDWSADRLVPDAARAWSASETLTIRSPDATRPWQHVLDVAHALVLIGARALAGGGPLRDAYNIGPDPDSVVTVGRLVEMLASEWGEDAKVRMEPPAWQAPEAQLLAVDSTLFRRDFRWHPQLTLAESVRRTVAWYKAFSSDPLSVATKTVQLTAESLDVRS